MNAVRAKTIRVAGHSGEEEEGDIQVPWELRRVRISEGRATVRERGSVTLTLLPSESAPLSVVCVNALGAFVCHS